LESLNASDVRRLLNNPRRARFGKPNTEHLRSFDRSALCTPALNRSEPLVCG
jgi:hypothetical protein